MKFGDILDVKYCVYIKFKYIKHLIKYINRKFVFILLNEMYKDMQFRVKVDRMFCHTNVLQLCLYCCPYSQILSLADEVKDCERSVLHY